jgi:putative protease
MGYVKNITAHYRKLLDELIEARQASDQPLARSSSGNTTFTFTPDPDQNFNREFTDYFVNGRQDSIGAFDSPKNPGQPIGFVTQVGPNWVELQLDDKQDTLHNGDGLCYYDLQKELAGLAVNRAEAQSLAKGKWRIFPKDPMAELKDLRKGTQVNRNRDVHWTRMLEKKSSDRRIGIWIALDQTERGLALTLTDEDGHSAKAHAELVRQPSKDAAAASDTLREHLSRLGNTIFQALEVNVNFSQPWFVPASTLNALRREVVDSLEANRAKAWTRLPRALPLQPPAPFPEDTLSYLGNVFNQAAHRFYAKHGVKVIAPAYEAMEELGEVSLMITKHCVRFSLSLCPKQAKGVTGVQGQVKAEPLQLINGREKLTLRFDCKPCEMHVVGKAKTAIARQTQEALAQTAQGQAVTFYKQRSGSEFGH